ncbi:TonB-linked outer membrane protein, SusC/RagA family [Chitinophaga jiangningensis]|uniref:TonB-linked outer membrane protein, SusC/RagA family n=1 Tax=Chitinophaga jiangningensis TaxID=1419482 RepID=A0A1M6WEN3_9BACT|nr:SusC/RagA family TonB-linked outer membrane protein [Chitinophaga jiangningensis]SHK92151.1 TonB-linked outer membrane protein, SusC/RagA family [Chitinophaga jiangningensis]
MRKILFALVACMLFTVSLFAQRTISGRVVDNDGEILPGVSVQIKGTQRGSITNAKGQYTLTVPENAKTLIFASIGFATQEIAIGSDNVIDVRMQMSAQSLNEVEIRTGYSSIKRNQYVGAASILGNRPMDATPVGSLDQALQGRVPGLQATSGSGQPGASTNVTIRGIQSIAGAGVQPLYILDGVPISSGDLAAINPNDLESMTVLKDAAAAALYGARGGVGVVVMTSKRGKAGDNVLTFRTQLGTTAPVKWKNMNMMNSAEMLKYEERSQFPGTAGWVYSPTNPANANLSEAQKARNAAILDSMGKINVDFADLFYRKGFSQSYELNASGGTEKSRYYWSGQVFDQKGTIDDSRLKRYVTRFNLDQNFGKFSMRLNSSLGYTISDYSDGEYLGNSARNPFQIVWRAKTYENPYKADGTLNYGTTTLLAPKGIANALEAINATTYREKQIKINTGLVLSYKILPSLTASNQIGLDASSNFAQRYVSANSFYGTTMVQQKGMDIEANRVIANIINTSSLQYANSFGKHSVEAGAFFEVIRNWQQGNGFYLYALDPRLEMTGQGAGTVITGGAASIAQQSSSAKTGYGIRSYFANGRYTYNDKYTINGLIRRDGTSRILNPSNKEISTWSVGASWNAIKEDFLGGSRILTDLRVRGSYGIIPNIGSINTTNYTMFGVTPTNGLLPVTNYMGNQYAGYGSVSSFLGSSISGIRPTAPGNGDLTIESIKKLNVGFDIALFDRIRLSADYYRNLTVDMFVTQPLSYTTAFTQLDINAGKMSNRGLELQLSGDVLKGKEYTLTLGWTHAINKNNIEDLGLVNEYVVGTSVIRKGLPYGTHYTPHYLGADPQTGRPMFEGADGKTVYDVSAAPNMATFGTYLPKHVGGFTLDARYKDFSMSALFSYQFDVVRSNNTYNWISRGSVGYQSSLNGIKELLTETWTKPGDQKFFQSPNYDRGFTSSDLMDAKFLRFRSLQFAYNVPAIKLKGNKLIKGAKIYAQGFNLAVWSPWIGQDPEDNNNISLNEYPNPKSWTAGIDITF